MDNQKKITEFFVKSIREQCEISDKAEENITENESISTQEFIRDARDRRSLRVQGKNVIKKCDDCDFSSSSTTLLLNHKERDHVESSKMRKQLSCDICGFKTTTNAVLKRHLESLHVIKEPKQNKRKACTMCSKQFNKESTLRDHIQKFHRQSIEDH